MTKASLILMLTMVCCSCADRKPPVESGKEDTLLYHREVIKEKNLTPTVDIKEYTLIASQGEDRKKDADQILDLKRKWPLVMQTPNRVGFDTILSRNFTFSGDGHFFNREDYILDRTTASDWKITFVKYDKLTLQFFGDIALLTYRNEVTDQHMHTKEVEVEYINWADIYVMEDGRWKIGATHPVDFRVEKK